MPLLLMLTSTLNKIPFKIIFVVCIIVTLSLSGMWIYKSRYNQGHDDGVSEQVERHRQELDLQWRNHLTKMVKLRRELSTKEIVYIEKEAEKEIIYETIREEVVKYISDNKSDADDNVDPAILHFYRKSINTSD